jgi:hypothetical protein
MPKPNSLPSPGFLEAQSMLSLSLFCGCRPILFVCSQWARLSLFETAEYRLRLVRSYYPKIVWLGKRSGVSLRIDGKSQLKREDKMPIAPEESLQLACGCISLLINSAQPA